MSHNIRETVPKLLRTLWELEKELRGAAQNSVVLRRDDARRHLSDARRHLDALLGLAQNGRPNDFGCQDAPKETPTPPTTKN